MEQVSAEATVRMDERGLVELDDAVPKSSKIDGHGAVLDAAELTTRKINAELRWLIYEQGIRDVTVLNPGAKHSIGVGILQRCRIRYEGSLGYFGLGLIDGPEITERLGELVSHRITIDPTIIAFETTRPGCRIRSSSSAYSRGRRSIGAPARSTRRVRRSSVRSATDRVVGSAARVPRRVSAWTRASSSGKANGLVR